MAHLWFIVAFCDLTSMLWACSAPALYERSSLLMKFCAEVNIFLSNGGRPGKILPSLYPALDRLVD